MVVAICVVAVAVVCGDASGVNGEDESEGGADSVTMTVVAVVGEGGDVIGAVACVVSEILAELATGICRLLCPKLAGCCCWQKELWRGVSDLVILSWRAGIPKSK